MNQISHYSSSLITRLSTYYHKHLNNFLCTKRLVKCNICDWEGNAFHDLDCGFGHIYRNALCPSCRSQPRHRSFHLYLEKVLDRGKRARLLHFAPEEGLTKFFKSYQNIDYLSVDISDPSAMQKEDITGLTFKDSTFDIIFCSHVLEHVQDDKKAMAELFRVLTESGFAIIDVPIDFNREQTYEDPSITSKEERTKAFWQHNHLRLYGRDFPEKLIRAGFQVKTEKLIESFGESKIRYFGLGDAPIYCCRR